MALQTNRPAFTQAQLAFVASADLQAGLFNTIKGQFEAHAVLFPLAPAVNSYGFTRAQMLTGLGSDAAEFNQAQKRLLQMAADLMPSFPGDIWAQQLNVRPWFALLTVTIPTGF